MNIAWKVSIKACFIAVALICLGIPDLFAGKSYASQPIENACQHFRDQPYKNPEGLSEDLHILSWNIQKHGHPDWKKDFEDLSKDIDMAFIQEAVLDSKLSIAAAVPMHQEFAPGFVSREKVTGVMTISTKPPLYSCNLKATEPWLKTPKAASIVEYELHKRDENLLAINVHAVNFSFGIGALREQFLALEQVLAKHSGPVILAGDLNTWNGQRQELVDEFMQSYSLQPVAFKPDHRSKVFGRPLDHIYVRGLVAESTEVIRVKSSDHNPLRVKLRLL